MSRPYSSRTLMSTGKVREIAEERAGPDAAAVVFVDPLTGRQRAVLGELLGCPVFSRTDLQPPGAGAASACVQRSDG